MNTPINSRMVRFAGLSAGLVAAALVLAACAPTASEEEAASTSMADQLTASDMWVKEPTSDMTGMFGMLENTGSSDIVLTGGESDVATMVEIHEVVDGQMQKIAGGLTIPAGSMAMLEPGGNHVMLMGLTSSILVGENVSVTLSFADGSSKIVSGVVKTTAGGEENYNEEPGHNMGM